MTTEISRDPWQVDRLAGLIQQVSGLQILGYSSVALAEFLIQQGVIVPPPNDGPIFSVIEWAADRGKKTGQLLGDGGTVIAVLDQDALATFLDMTTDAMEFLSGTATVIDQSPERKKSEICEVQWETFRTGTGQKLRVHSRDRCQGEHCVIHRPMPGPWDNEPDWLTHWRSDRRIMERWCPHGVGHTALDGVKTSDLGVHGCDGCCIGKGPINE